MHILRNAFLLASVVLCSAICKAVTIYTVTVSGPVSDPTISVTGSGFGAEPTDLGPAFAGYTGDNFGTELYFNDHGSKGFQAGNGGDTVGLVVSTYTDTSVVFTLGNTYSNFYYPYNYFAVQAGDAVSVTIKGVSAPGIAGQTVGSLPPVPTPEPSSLLLLGSGIVSAAAAARRRSFTRP